MSTLDRDIVQTPFAVLAVETTGLSPIHDRLLELTVVVVRPGDEPQVVFDSLIHPERPVTATDIHGITDADVASAPKFSEIADALVAAFANRVVCAHNAWFEIAFVVAELARCERVFAAPHVCTMLLPRAIDGSVPHLSLTQSCSRWKIDPPEAHAARPKAMTAAKLLRHHHRELRRRGVRTFEDLRRCSSTPYAFFESFEQPLVAAPSAMHFTRSLSPRDRPAAQTRRSKVAEYLDAVMTAAGDMHLDPDERGSLRMLSRQLGLSDAEARAVHAKIFWGMLGRYVEDARIDVVEAAHLGRLRRLLHELGWAPGDDAAAPSSAATGDA